ncbi:MAG: DUF2062 domain-containing protein [Rhodospirillaceae bacterium]
MFSNSSNTLSALRKYSWWNRMKRVVKYRLLIPIKRSKHPPEYTARGVAVGMAWALTPSIGIQMVFCFVTWLVAKKVFKWDFSVLIAMAWTWTTNVVTAIPCFYLFFVTGQIILKGFDDLSGYEEFSRQWEAMVRQDSDMSYLESLWREMSIAAEVWGVPLLLGCLPWSVLGGLSGYYLSLRFIRRHRAAKQRRRLQQKTKVIVN